MQKHAFSSVGSYHTRFAPLPVSAREIVYFDKCSTVLPCSENFPMLHYHDRYEIGVCENGEGLFLLEGVFSSVSKGDFIFIAPGRYHYSRSFNQDEPCICRFAYLRPQTAEELMTVAGAEGRKALECIAQRVPTVVRASQYPKATALLSAILEACTLDTTDGSALAALRLSAFLLEAQSLFEASPTTPTVHRSDDAVDKISEYIALNYNGSDTARELAQRCHLSESQLRRRFLAVYGMPPIAYRNFLRCKIAAELLVRTRLTVSEIAERIGFNAVSDFYRVFRKNYRISPSAYRKESGK